MASLAVLAVTTTITATAHCIGGCGWTVNGDLAEVDKQADRHTKAGHPTGTVVVPAATMTGGQRR